jgi:hypothetical protein
MNIVWPSDHGDDDVWDVLMDTAVRVTIDGHNHSPGGGAQINFSSLKWDADISAVDPGGNKHALKNLLAAAFFPSPSSAMAGFAGAFFVSDGTGGLALNELYFRTIGGANVKVTNGAALNVVAFTGGIGGDYSSIGALELFDDGTDAYWFQQQVGAGSVRQYAKMRCADVQLFEFRSTASGVVPGQAVTLKSPAALAAGYALTFPGALPVGAKPAPLTVDASGNIAAGAVETIQLSPLAPAAGTGGWRFATITTTFNVPIPLRNGHRILAVRARFKDNVTGPTKLTVGLQSLVDGGSITTIATSAQSAGTGAAQTLSASGLTTTIASGTNYQALINVVTGSANCELYWIEVDYDRP